MELKIIQGSSLCSNIYILKDGKFCVVIDSGDGSIEIKEKVDFCFLTHGHFDHTSGTKEDWNVFLRREDFINDYPYFVPEWTKKLEAKEMKIGEFELEFIHTPGHTPGSICIFERRNRILFTGDTLFSDGWVGRTDLPGGDWKKMENSLRMLLKKFGSKYEDIPIRVDEMDLHLLCPGHGSVKRFKK